MKPIDLHVHSNKSDGSNTPSELVYMAMQKGLSAFALTDHDTVDGIDEALNYAKKLREENSCVSSFYVPEIIPGIELSTEYQGKDIHMVGLYIDHNSSVFQNHLKHFVDSRVERNRKMCARLSEAGIDISYEKLIEEFPDSVLTRAHYAVYLVKYGYSLSKEDAFSQYLGDHTKYFVPREKITPEMGVKLILDAGGIPILAHPILYRMSDTRLEALVARLKQVGLVGIEAIYATYTLAEERQIRKLAAKYDLCISGGSDYHGDAKPGLEMGTGYGKLFVPEDILNALR
jgi:predicted metal-dependent phosphoesterase TrpH